jgi:multisubunit Na+/H+ antiporter MnhB subunit
MEQIVMCAVVLGVVLVVKRREAFVFRWQPDRGTWISIGTGLLAFVLSAVLLLLEPGPIGSGLLH